jgi:hypothetical protein
MKTLKQYILENEIEPVKPVVPVRPDPRRQPPQRPVKPKEEPPARNPDEFIPTPSLPDFKPYKRTK